MDMSPELISLLIQAREAIGKLEGIGSHMPNHRLLLRPLQQREALRSSSMEGTHATPEQLFLYEMDHRGGAEEEQINVSFR